MTTVTKTQVTFRLSNQKTSVINLPAPINNEIVDPDTGDPLITQAAIASLASVFEDDSGATIESASVRIIKTDTNEVVSEITPL